MNEGQPDIEPPPIIGRPSGTQPPREPIDAEREFGAKILPWIGAGSVVFGLVYLVNYAIQRELITPEMQMGGSALLASIFVAIGMFVARATGESKVFGNLLVGLGSCGLYMTAAGGYAGWKLITGETMVGFFILLAFANLLYGYWKSLPPFVLMGAAGGAIASGMLAQRGDYNLAVGILGLIGIPAFYALVARRAPYWVGGVWLIGALSIATWAPSEDVAISPYLIGFWLLGALCAHAAAFRRSSVAEDIYSPLLIGILGTAHLFACTHSGWAAAGIFAAVGVGCLLISSLIEGMGRSWMLGIGALIAGVVAPGRLEKEWMLVAFAGLSLVLLVASLRGRKELAVLALVDLFIAGLLYIVVMGEPRQRWLPFDELSIIPFLAVTVLGATYLLTRAAREAKEFEDCEAAIRIIAALATWGLAVRYVHLQVGAGDLRLEAMTIAWGGCATLAFLIGSWLKARELRIFGLGLLMATLARTMIVDLADLESVYKVMILIGMGILSLIISYAFYIKPGRTAKPS